MIRHIMMICQTVLINMTLTNICNYSQNILIYEVKFAKKAIIFHIRNIYNTGDTCVFIHIIMYNPYKAKQ